MYSLKALKFHTEQELLAFWCLVFMPLIIKAALPLASISDEKYVDGIAAGLMLVVLNISGRGTFDAKKGNVISWFEKAIAGVRMEARKEAQAGTTSLDAKAEVTEIEIEDPDSADPVHYVPSLVDELMAEIAAVCLPHPTEPDEDAIKYGDPENDRILFKVPEETFVPVYTSKQTVFKMVNGKPVEIETTKKVVPSVARFGASGYADEESDDTTDRAWRTYINPETGELDTDYAADFRRDEDDENDFPAFMEDHGGKFSKKAVRGLHQWMPKGRKTWFISPFSTPKRKETDPVEPIKEEVELMTPDDTEAERITNPYALPTQEQLKKALEVYEANAAAIKHLAYLQWKGQAEVTVKKMDLDRKGFITVDDKFLSLKDAAGMAAMVRPVSGTQQRMAELALQKFPGNADAHLFAKRIAAVDALHQLAQ